MQAFHEDLNGRQYINEVYKFSVDKMYDILFAESQFMNDFMELRRFSGQLAFGGLVWSLQQQLLIWHHRHPSSAVRSAVSDLEDT